MKCFSIVFAHNFFFFVKYILIEFGCCGQREWKRQTHKIPPENTLTTHNRFQYSSNSRVLHSLVYATHKSVERWARVLDHLWTYMLIDFVIVMLLGVFSIHESTTFRFSRLSFSICLQTYFRFIEFVTSQPIYSRTFHPFYNSIIFRFFKNVSASHWIAI